MKIYFLLRGLDVDNYRRAGNTYPWIIKAIEDKYDTLIAFAPGIVENAIYWTNYILIKL